MAAFWQTYGWVVLGLTAGAGWGMSYILYEKLLLRFPIPLVMFLTGAASFAFFGLVAWSRGHFAEIKTITSSPAIVWGFIGVVVLNILANTSILTAVNMSNASRAAFLEISYPLFSLLFAYLIFKEIQLSALGMVGGGFIVLGTIIMVYAGK